eukprot:jgi/Mesvir1/4321/Mv16255-RA.1
MQSRSFIFAQCVNALRRSAHISKASDQCHSLPRVQVADATQANCLSLHDHGMHCVPDRFEHANVVCSVPATLAASASKAVADGDLDAASAGPRQRNARNSRHALRSCAVQKGTIVRNNCISSATLANVPVGTLACRDGHLPTRAAGGVSLADQPLSHAQDSKPSKKRQGVDHARTDNVRCKRAKQATRGDAGHAGQDSCNRHTANADRCADAPAAVDQNAVLPAPMPAHAMALDRHDVSLRREHHPAGKVACTAVPAPPAPMLPPPPRPPARPAEAMRMTRGMARRGAGSLAADATSSGIPPSSTARSSRHAPRAYTNRQQAARGGASSSCTPNATPVDTIRVASRTLEAGNAAAQPSTLLSRQCPGNPGHLAQAVRSLSVIEEDADEELASPRTGPRDDVQQHKEDSIHQQKEEGEDEMIMMMATLKDGPGSNRSTRGRGSSPVCDPSATCQGLPRSSSLVWGLLAPPPGHASLSLPESTITVASSRGKVTSAGLRLDAGINAMIGGSWLLPLEERAVVEHGGVYIGAARSADGRPDDPSGPSTDVVLPPDTFACMAGTRGKRKGSGVQRAPDIAPAAGNPGPCGAAAPWGGGHRGSNLRSGAAEVGLDAGKYADAARVSARRYSLRRRAAPSVAAGSPRGAALARLLDAPAAGHFVLAPPACGGASGCVVAVPSTVLSVQQSQPSTSSLLPTRVDKAAAGGAGPLPPCALASAPRFASPEGALPSGSPREPCRYASHRHHRGARDGVASGGDGCGYGGMVGAPVTAGDHLGSAAPLSAARLISHGRELVASEAGPGSSGGADDGIPAGASVPCGGHADVRGHDGCVAAAHVGRPQRRCARTKRVRAEGEGEDGRVAEGRGQQGGGRAAGDASNACRKDSATAPAAGAVTRADDGMPERVLADGTGSRWKQLPRVTRSRATAMLAVAAVAGDGSAAPRVVAMTRVQVDGSPSPSLRDGDAGGNAGGAVHGDASTARKRARTGDVHGGGIQAAVVGGREVRRAEDGSGTAVVVTPAAHVTGILGMTGVHRSTLVARVSEHKAAALDANIFSPSHAQGHAAASVPSPPDGDGAPMAASLASTSGLACGPAAVAAAQPEGPPVHCSPVTRSRGIAACNACDATPATAATAAKGTLLHQGYPLEASSASAPSPTVVVRAGAKGAAMDGMAGKHEASGAAAAANITGAAAAAAAAVAASYKSGAAAAATKTRSPTNVAAAAVAADKCDGHAQPGHSDRSPNQGAPREDNSSGTQGATPRLTRSGRLRQEGQGPCLGSPTTPMAAGERDLKDMLILPPSRQPGAPPASAGVVTLMPPPPPAVVLGSTQEARTLEKQARDKRGGSAMGTPSHPARILARLAAPAMATSLPAVVVRNVAGKGMVHACASRGKGIGGSGKDVRSGGTCALAGMATSPLESTNTSHARAAPIDSVPAAGTETKGATTTKGATVIVPARSSHPASKHAVGALGLPSHASAREGAGKGAAREGAGGGAVLVTNASARVAHKLAVFTSAAGMLPGKGAGVRVPKVVAPMWQQQGPEEREGRMGGKSKRMASPQKPGGGAVLQAKTQETSVVGISRSPLHGVPVARERPGTGPVLGNAGQSHGAVTGASTQASHQVSQCKRGAPSSAAPPPSSQPRRGGELASAAAAESSPQAAAAAATMRGTCNPVVTPGGHRGQGKSTAAGPKAINQIQATTVVVPVARKDAPSSRPALPLSGAAAGPSLVSPLRPVKMPPPAPVPAATTVPLPSDAWCTRPAGAAGVEGGAAQGRQRHGVPPVPAPAPVPVVEVESYAISPYRYASKSDSDSLSEDLPKVDKAIPSWARMANLWPALQAQHRVDPDAIFRAPLTCSLEDVFGEGQGRLRKRANSGDWCDDWQHEEEAYKRAMGYL